MKNVIKKIRCYFCCCIINKEKDIEIEIEHLQIEKKQFVQITNL
tara:strand:- start:7054 stop:7185 length:132 start_codon:yes stop_codon:yes gene_type:complete